MPEGTTTQDPQDLATIRLVLATPLDPDNPLDKPDATVRDYLVESLAQLVGGDLSAKYGLSGGDDWHYDLYVPLRDAGLLPAWKDGWGLDAASQQRADALLAAAARALVAPTGE